jgi:phosphoadenosine phosphosulfate reductase
MIRPELQKKIDFAIMLIQQAEKTSNEYFNGEPVEISYSGGKDSDVILQLAKEAGINFIPIYIHKWTYARW